jgi:PAS domain S-box-containing protein
MNKGSTEQDAVITTDTDARITSMNAVAESLTGWATAEAVGQPLDAVFRIVNEQTRQGVKDPASRALREGVIVGLANHTVLIAKDNTERPIDDSAAPIRRAGGEVVGCVLVFRDVTSRRADEKALRESEGRLRRSEEQARRTLAFHDAVTNNMGEGLYAVDAQGLVTYMNPAAEAMLGWTFGELKGRKMHDMTHHHYPDGRPFPIEECAGFQVLHHGKVLKDHDDYFIRKDDGFFPVTYSSSPLRSGDKVVGVVVVFRDNTERKRAEEALKEADRRKEEFLATLAHELRSPLAPLRNGLQVMKLVRNDGPATEEARGMMERQLGHLVRLVDDLLDVSRISRGKIELRKERVTLSAVVSSVLETCEPIIKQGGHELTLAVPEEPIHVDADRTRLAQALCNLVSNAAKYTDRGGHIWLTVERQGSDAVLSVKDTGTGIPADMLPQIFELFTQIDRSLERSHGGLGVGLTIVKRLVEMHGGRVEAHSEGYGMGSEFIIRLPVVLPVAQEQRERAEVERVGPAARRRVLVVDDNVDAASSLAMMLKLMGNDTQTAHDGLEAMDMAAAFKPDVILLDIGMPKLNGYEVARRIRQEAWGRNVVLVACTGWGQEEDKRRSQEAGFNLHMVKPVDPAALEKTLAGLKVDTA